MNKKNIILSINPIAHDTAAALMIDGEIVGACEQERYTKDKHSRKFPIDAALSCLDSAEVTIEDLTLVVVPYDVKKGVREYYLKNAIIDDARLEFLVDDIDRVKHLLTLEQTIKEKLGYEGEVKFVDHHMSHMSSAYYTSGYKDALVVSYDGLGEIDTMGISVAKNGDLQLCENDNKYPQSLGLLYAAVTNYLGWKYASDEGIVMGLASYGNPDETIPGDSISYYEAFEEIIEITGDYTFNIDFPNWMNFYNVRDAWVGKKFLDTFGPKRHEDGELTQHHKNIASALQKRIEEIVIHQLTAAKKKYNQSNLCISGGVGLNCSLNGKILSSNLFDNIYVVPPSGDPGTNIGACFLGYQYLGNSVEIKKRHNFYLGSKYDDDKIKDVLDSYNSSYKYSENICLEAAKIIEKGNIIGWFQGSAEFGPRALGNRSILAKPYPASMKDYVNKRIKFREEFRPFAPAVLHEFYTDYFDMKQESPHMLMAVKVRESAKDSIAATVHIDGSARVQTVKQSNNLPFWNLLKEFDKLTGIPVLLNTSFNVKGQPVVNSPEDAIQTFYDTNLDYLIIGDYLVSKT